MNDATPTRTKCRPAVRLSYDTREIEDTLTAFGHLEEAARSAVDAIYRRSLKSVYISSEGYVYSASVQHGDFLVNFAVTSNLFSATRIEYNPDEDPTDIFDGEIIKILGDGDIIILPSSPLTHTVCFLPSNEDGETYIVFSIELIGDTAFLTCAPPDRINFENNIVLENETTVFVSDYDLDEAGEIIFEISLSSPVRYQIEIEYTIDFTILENGESRNAVSGSFTFEPGQTNAVVIIECERSLPDAEMHLANDHNRPTLTGTINDCLESTTGMEEQMIHKNWVELIKPTQLEIKPSSAPARQATVIAEPLERGFGRTINDMITGGARNDKAAWIASDNEQPKRAYRSHNCAELRNSHIGDTVRLCGWVHRVRNHGGVLFIDLRDHYGTTQVIADGDSPVFAELEKVRNEWCIRIDGNVLARDESLVNPSLPTGEVEVFIRDFDVLCALEEHPFIEFGVHERPEETRLRYRHLDLRHEVVQANTALHSDEVASICERIWDKLFNEFGTPIITPSSTEGARDFLVPSRLHPGKFYALPQAPQLIMVSGFDKYFQIAPCFRDVDLRGNRSSDGYYQDKSFQIAPRFCEENPRADCAPNDFYQLDVKMSLVGQGNMSEHLYGAGFVLADDDDGGIMDLWVREARLFKYGCGTDTITVGSVQAISDGNAIFDDADFDLTIGNGSAIFGGTGRILVNGDEGMLSGATGFAQIIGDGSASFGGAGIDRTHGGDDAIFDGAGNARAAGGDASHGVPGKVNFTETHESAISPVNRARSCEWGASKSPSGTYRKELFPQQDHIAHKVYIDDSLYISYIASRSNSLGRCGEAPQQTPH